MGYEEGVPFHHDVTVASEFTRGGYQTRAIGKLHVFPPRSLIGFQHVVLHDGLDTSDETERVDDYVRWLRNRLGASRGPFDHGIDPNSFVSRPWDKPEWAHPTNYIVDMAIEFLSTRDPGMPFFLLLSFYHPHPPYTPPTWAFEQYMRETFDDPPVGDWAQAIWGELSSPYRADTWAGPVDPRMLQRARAGYYGLMSHIDQQVNRFVEKLEASGLRDNTLLVFTSDHGEMMGDHNLFRKTVPYEGSARVPLFFSPPPGLARIDGPIRDEVMELRDIMPTLLDYAGLPIPANLQGDSAIGLGSDSNRSWRTHLHGEHVLLRPRRQAVHWLTDGRTKYIWFSGSGIEQLFDLENDPDELDDLAHHPAQDDRLVGWRNRLIIELQGRPEGFSNGKELFPGRKVRHHL